MEFVKLSHLYTVDIKNTQIKKQNHENDSEKNYWITKRDNADDDPVQQYKSIPDH